MAGAEFSAKKFAMSQIKIITRTKISNVSMGENLGEDSLSWVPPVDIYETDSQYVLNAELPGVDAEDVVVEVGGTEVSIRGERRHVCSSESYHRLEGVRGPFHRSFSLPEPLNAAEVTATLKDGLLQVRLSKSGGAKKIPITTRRPPH
jgi:HSP20 family protein